MSDDDVQEQIARQPELPCGDLCLQGWAGFSRQRVRVVGETPRRYRIEAITRTRLPGRRRYLAPGETTLVPKSAIREPPP